MYKYSHLLYLLKGELQSLYIHPCTINFTEFGECEGLSARWSKDSPTSVRDVKTVSLTRFLVRALHGVSAVVVSSDLTLHEAV